MSDSYLTLHKLQETETPFTVSRVVDEELQSSPECTLPADSPLVFDLPSLDVTLPDLDCTFNIDLPLTPLPYYCNPTVSGEITVTGSPGLAVTNSVEIVKSNDCDYLLQGDIVLTLDDRSVVCVDGYTADETSVGIQTGDHLTASGSLSLTQEACVFKLESDLKIELEDVTCIDGYTVADGTVTASADAPLSVTGGITLSINTVECALSLESDLNFTLDCSSIGLRMGSGINEEFTIVVNIGSGDSKGNLGLYKVEDGCIDELRGNPYITLYLPLEEYEVTVCNGTSTETVTLYKKVA